MAGSNCLQAFTLPKPTTVVANSQLDLVAVP
jgi:hypothetical protein